MEGKATLHKLKITSYALIILLILVLPSQADEYCTTADMCAAAAQAAGKMLGNEGKNGITGYPFVLETNTYGCWYYPDSHPNKNYAGSAFWGAASSQAQMRDPDPGSAHHVRLKCGVANAAPEAQLTAPGMPIQADGFCITEDACASAAQAEGLRLGNDSYPFALPTNTYGCWYYPRSHANKNYAGSAFWGAASTEAQMTDPDPGEAHHVRLKCEGGGSEQSIETAAQTEAAETQVVDPVLPPSPPVRWSRSKKERIGKECWTEIVEAVKDTAKCKEEYQKMPTMQSEIWCPNARNDAYFSCMRRKCKEDPVLKGGRCY